MNQQQSPKFSIIVPHYDGSVPDDRFERGIQSLLDQEFKNFEVLIYHDGPVSRPIPNIWEKLEHKKLTISNIRYNDWGHSLRDIGIKEAAGDYIIHFNPDNILYSNALKELNDLIEDDTYVVLKGTDNFGKQVILGSNNIIIYPIIMIGHYRWGLQAMVGTRIKEDTKHGIIMTGDPAEWANIDCMQLVMKRSLWLDYGGWYNKQETSDGFMYSRFVTDHPARLCNKVLGEHW